MVWQQKPLAQLCELFTDGEWIETKDQSNSGVRLVQTGNVGAGEFKDRVAKARFISENTFSRLKCTEVFPGDCLISRLPDPVGRACVIPDTGSKMITSVDCTIIRFKNNKILPRFFNYFSQSMDYLKSVEVKTSGATRKRISRKNLGGVEIPVPTLTEQKQIVAILDDAFANIDHARQLAERNLKNANELFESTLHKFFSQSGKGWSTKTLTSVCVIKPPKSEARNKLDDNSQVSFVPMDCLGIGNKKLQLRQERKLREVAGSYTYFAENDVLLAKITPCFENGKLGIARNLKNKVGFGSSEFIVFRCGDEILPDFLYYYLDRQSFRDESKALMTGAVGHKRVAKDFIENYLISYPDIERQEEIVIILDELRNDVKKLEKIYQQKITALDELKQSLLRKAFRGELTQGQAAA